MDFKKMPEELQEGLCRFFEKEMENDPNCPRHILAGLDAAQAIRELHEVANGLIDACKPLVDAEDVGSLHEIEQYAKLVTTGIRQYLAAIRKDGAP